MAYQPGDYLINVARGDIEGASPFASYGELVTSGAVTNRVIWPDGDYNLPPAAGLQMALSSTSANDTSAGTGIRSVELHYLDANLAPQAETITLNGLTPVNTTATNIRFIQCMHMIAYGSGKVAAGTISAISGGVTYSQIAAGSNRCASSARMVPAGKVLMVQSISGGSSSGSAAASTRIRLASTYFEGHDYSADSVFIPSAAACLQDGNSTLTLGGPFPFPAGAAVALVASSDKAATIVGSWFGWLENA